MPEDVTAPPLTQLAFQYQPVVALKDAGMDWSEALIRWNLPDGTVRGPLEILPHWLSESRQDAFTRFSIERVAGTLALHVDARISINLSPRQLTDPQAVASLEKLLPDVRARLGIELTEQRFGDTKRLWGAIGLVRKLCSVVLLDDVTEADLHDRTTDDRLVDGVKVDRSITLGLIEGTRRTQLERFISDLAKRFPIVVVEGIEDVALCDRLRELGATHVQGFGIARPRPELLSPLTELSLPTVESAAAKAIRLNFGSLMLADGGSELQS